MKEILNSLVQAMGEQVKAVGTVADEVAAMKRTLAKHHDDQASELKAQIEAGQEKNRTSLYDLQVSLAKVKEAIAQLPDATPAERKKGPANEQRKEPSAEKELEPARKLGKEQADGTPEEAPRAAKKDGDGKGTQEGTPTRSEEPKSKPKPGGEKK